MRVRVRVFASAHDKSFVRVERREAKRVCVRARVCEKGEREREREKEPVCWLPVFNEGS